MATTMEARMIFRAKDYVSGVTSRMANNIIRAQKRVAHINRAATIVSGVGKKLSAAVTLPAGLAANAIFRASMEFDRMRNSAQAAGRISNEAMKPVEALSRKIASNSKFSPTQVMSGAKYLFKSGMKTAAVLGVLAGATNLAAAGELDLAQSADIATNVLTGMGLPMKTTIEAQKSMARVSDLLAFAASNSNTDVRRLGESFKYVAPLASKAGISAEQLTAAFMVMAQSGISGSEAGVAMRSAIVRMVRPTKGMIATLGQMGISIDDYVTSTKKAGAGSFMDMFDGSGYDVRPLKKQISALFADESLKDDPKRLVESLNRVILDGMGDNSAEGREKVAKMVNGYFGGLAENVDFIGFIKALSKSKAGVGLIARIFDAKQGGRLATLIGDGKLADALLRVNTEAKGATASMAKILMRGSVGDYDRMVSAYQNLLLAIGKSGVMNEAARAMRALGKAFSYLSKRADASYEGIAKIFQVTNKVDLGKMSGGVKAELAGLLADTKLQQDPDKFARLVADTISRGVGEGLTKSQAKETIDTYMNSLTDTSPYLKWGTFAVMGLAVLGPLTWALTNVVSGAAKASAAIWSLNMAGASFGKGLPKRFDLLGRKIRRSSKDIKVYNKRVALLTKLGLGGTAFSNLVAKKSVFERLRTALSWMGKAPMSRIAGGIRGIVAAAGLLLAVSWPVLLGAAAISLVIAKWEGLKAFFSSFFGELGRQFKRFGEDSGIARLWQYLEPARKAVSEFLGMTDGKNAKGLENWAKAGKIVAKVIMAPFRILAKVAGSVVAAIEQVIRAYNWLKQAAKENALGTLFDSLVMAIRRALNPLETLKNTIAWIYNKVSQKVNWFGGSAPKVPALPYAAKGTGMRGSVIPARAKGGDIGAGQALVGENGPEIVEFSQPGTVIPNHKIDYLAKVRAGALAAAMGSMPVAVAAQPVRNDNRTQSFNLTFNVEKGADENDIARVVVAQINKSLNVSGSASYSD